MLFPRPDPLTSYQVSRNNYAPSSYENDIGEGEVTQAFPAGAALAPALTE